MPSQQLGLLEVPEEELITFAGGLPGFPDAHRFCLVQVKPGSRFRLLQSADRPDLAFVVTQPELVDPGYPLEEVQRAATRLGLLPDEPVAVAAIVTVPPPPERPTANLMAPLVIGGRSRAGVQVILHDGGYGTRHGV